MSRYGSASSHLTPAMLAGMVVAVPIIGIATFFWTNPGLFWKIWIIMQYNELFWFLNVFGIVWAVVCWRRNPEEFTIYELPGQILVSFILLLMISAFCFYETTDIKDQETWNGAYTHAIHEEEWTGWVHKTCTREDADGNEETYDCSYEQYHPPTWTAYITYGEAITLTPAQYQNLSTLWGGTTIIGTGHAGQISWGNGRTFQATVGSREEQQVPTARRHRFVNYLKASHSIKLRSGIRGYDTFLAPYPAVHSGSYGEIEIDRVTVLGSPISSQWQFMVDQKLDRALITMGGAYQIDILVYIVGTSDQGFLHALEERWMFGKKNNLIIIIGSTDGDVIEWVDCIAWTDHELFKTELRDRIRALQTLKSNAHTLVDAITSQVQQPGEEGWKRTPMKEKQYLVHDISLPWWAGILLTLFYGAFAWLCSWAFANNAFALRMRRYDPLRRNRFDQY